MTRNLSSDEARREPGASAPVSRGRLAVALLAAALGADIAFAQETPQNPYLDQKEALEEGERIYRARCIGCHFRGGGRGPSIFRSKLTLVQFVEIVAKGGGPGMPAWGATLSGEDILKLHAFVMSRDRL
ncbi:MAG TPA: cytochrome c [Burkholderiales bacterium]|nr:cytochrome c [Burkholderiales bacterium]